MSNYDWKNVDLIVKPKILEKIEEKHNLTLAEIYDALKGFVLEAKFQPSSHDYPRYIIYGETSKTKKVIKIILDEKHYSTFYLVSAYIPSSEKTSEYKKRKRESGFVRDSWEWR